MKRKTRISAVMLVAILFFAGALPTACVPPGAETPPDEVTVKLKWVH